MGHEQVATLHRGYFSRAAGQTEAPVEVVTPLFAEEEGLYAQSGVLFHCPSLIDGPQRYPEDSFFPTLELATAQGFLKRRAARLA